ncbi:MAG: hypothetical protein CMJ59_12095 [Planctomycetaceae bacterium]|nr:hypothetical protein [Planctomycetaceae bacterium]
MLWGDPRDRRIEVDFDLALTWWVCAVDSEQTGVRSTRNAASHFIRHRDVRHVRVRCAERAFWQPAFDRG